jgi:hypothetical protein
MTFDEWLDSYPEDEKCLLLLSEAWDAAVKATIQALLDSGNLSEQWTATAKTLLTDNEYADKD